MSLRFGTNRRKSNSCCCGFDSTSIATSLACKTTVLSMLLASSNAFFNSSNNHLSAISPKISAISKWKNHIIPGSFSGRVVCFKHFFIQLFNFLWKSCLSALVTTLSSVIIGLLSTSVGIAFKFSSRNDCTVAAWILSITGTSDAFKFVRIKYKHLIFLIQLMYTDWEIWYWGFD